MDNYLINTETFQLTQADFIIRLLVSLGIGAIIGLEREYTAMKEKVEAFAGIRTFIFVALLGLIAGMTFYLLSPLVYAGILLAVIILTGVSYWITASKGDIGATTEFSLLAVFFLGTLSLLGLIVASLAITVVMVVLLSVKLQLRTIVGKITAEELYAFIRFVVVALLIFPFLPDQNLGPYNVINPREIGWVIILTSGLGFAGYILMRLLGASRGILLSGIMGGLVSSTAVTWVFAKKSKENEALSHSCSIAILAASSIMIIRVLVWTFLFNRTLFNKTYLSILLVFLAGIGITLLIYYKYHKQKRKEKIEATIPKTKPLDLQGALVFGLIYIVILLVVSYANDQLGEKGMLLSSAIAGLSDIDAITISVSKLAHSNLDLSIAANAVIIAAISNTLVKMGIGIWAGSRKLRKYLYMGYGVIFIAALIALLIQNR
ncbi:MgtC/SapB family protein [Terrimonas pollutisoli]|uniref:MgtC/SapB family protein n=1 Tax=Terrimonas pollutisoli TaxID=3034147 RepID=UPI0023EB7083|nr:MgtC/SapB family protein [Terrimonas sp. H1YJ31]